MDYLLFVILNVSFSSNLKLLFTERVFDSQIVRQTDKRQKRHTDGQVNKLENLQTGR